MKRLAFLTTALLMLFAINVHAQPGRPHEPMTPEQLANRMVKGLTEELKLDENQQKELKAYFTEQFEY